MQGSLFKWRYIRHYSYLGGVLVFIYAWLIGARLENSLVIILSMVILGILLAFESYRIQKNDPPKTNIKNKKVASVLATFVLWIFFMSMILTVLALSGSNHSAHHSGIQTDSSHE